MTEPRRAQGHPCPRAHRPRRRLLPLAAALAGTMVAGVAGMTLGAADGTPGAGSGAGAAAMSARGAAGARGVPAAGAREVRGAAGAPGVPAAGARGGGSAAGREAGAALAGSPGAAAVASLTASSVTAFATPPVTSAGRAGGTGRAYGTGGTGRGGLRTAGLGPETLARVPANARQVLVVKGAGPDANRGTARLYTRTEAGGWLPGRARPARNALRGWTDDHHSGDLRSPAGVYRIGDAGGLLPNPGTHLPYDRSDEFAEDGTGFTGESLATAFDHVLAIDYNRVAGVSPLDRARPLGEERGGGIWVHVDHGGPTHGCVSLARADLVALLRELRPQWHPVIAMGDGERLAR
ncbi:hypothetical protein [Streptomyces sp. NPDC088923]|uniref:hypothetical protein n=1 Tax=Streptomyces sp. NPDC088923 TaxID=3365913 RepID=UPI00381B483E